MTDLLIRDVPDDVVSGPRGQRPPARAVTYGVPAENAARERSAGGGEVTVDDLVRFADTFADLADPEVMRRAWE